MCCNSDSDIANISLAALSHAIARYSMKSALTS